MRSISPASIIARLQAFALFALCPPITRWRGARIKPTDLHNLPFIALSPEDRARQRITEVFDKAGARPHIVVETPNSATICALALEGAGLGLVNPAATDGFEERGLVLKPFDPAVYFKAYILFRPDAQRARLVRDFAAALTAALRNETRGRNRLA